MKRIFVALLLVVSLSGCNKGDTGDIGPQGNDGPQGPAGQTVVSIWSYHIDSAAGAPNLAAAVNGVTVNLTDVRISLFTDGTAFAAVNGTVIGTDSNGDTYNDDFSHSFYLPATSGAQATNYKLTTENNVDIEYTMTTSPGTPTFAAVADVPSNLSNDTSSNFTLTETY